MKSADKKHERTGNARLIWGLTEVNVTYANPNREVSGIGNPSFLGGKGKKVKQYTYGLAQNSRDRPPEVRTFQEELLPHKTQVPPSPGGIL